MVLGAFTKAARQILTIKTTLGSDDLLMLGMTGEERLGRLPHFDLDMVSNVDMLGAPKDIDLHKLVGTRATVSMELDGALTSEKRHFNGYIVRAERGERHGRFMRYHATMRPWPWFMTQRRNSRIFQDVTVKDVLTKVFGEYSSDHEMRLVFPLYPKMDYCVQYDETDFDFVSRLMERFGIYYYFEHTDSSHKMVLVDLTITHKPKKSPMPVMWSNTLKQGQSVMNWSAYEEVRSQKVVATDYDYLSPTGKIEGTKEASSPASKLGKMEVFAHPSHVAENSAKDSPKMMLTEPSDAAKLLFEERNSLIAAYGGVTNQRDMAVGATFIIANTPRGADKGMYLMVEGRYTMAFADHEAIDDLKDIQRRRDGFRCEFICINSLTGTFRPERTTPVPRVHGPQTAIVTGGPADEITTDKHGRIKVQFRWDREGKKDRDSSCWLRVAQPWAGKSFGMIALPRVGHEVVVSFLDGNPDRPIVTGSVYNGDNTPIYPLPDNATVTGIKTRSSKGGGEDNANELRFDDAKGKEYLWFQAENNYFRFVKKNAFDLVGEEETVKVKKSRSEVIGENWYMDIGKDVMHHIGKDLHVNVAADIFYTGGATFQAQIAKDMSVSAGGDLGIEVGGKTALRSAADINVQSKTGKITFKTATGDFAVEAMSVKIKGTATIALECPGGISLKVGGSIVNVSPAGVDIVGPMVKINSGGAAGSAGSAPDAAPTKPAEAKKPEDLTKPDYDKKFEDPLKKTV